MFNLRDGRTADGEENTPELSKKLRQAWGILASHYMSLVGDFESCANYGFHGEQHHSKEWTEMMRFSGAEPWPSSRPCLVHVEALVMTRLSRPLYEFYRAIREDERDKVLVAPGRLKGATRMLDCGFHQIPLETAWQESDDLIHYLDHHRADVFMFCGGRASKIVMAGLLARKPGRTYIDIGSGLDPLFYGKTRWIQVKKKDAEQYFSGLFGCREKAILNFRDFIEAAEAVGLKWVLMDGTLLGAIRDKDFCPGDENDIDIGIMDADYDAVADLIQYMTTKTDPPFKNTETFRWKGKIEGEKLKRGESHFDLVRIHRHPRRSECYNLGRRVDVARPTAFVYPAWHHLNPPEEIDFLGFKVRVPAGADSLLTERYGDWKTPIPAHEFCWYKQSNLSSIQNEYDMIEGG